MPVDHKNKLAFCHIPRTGGVSVSNALKMTVEDRHLPVSWHRNQYPGYFLFTIIRNYEDRIKSTFGWETPPEHGSIEFNSLVEKTYKKGERNIGLMLKPNEYFLDGDVDFMIRFEHLQEDLNDMLESRGLQPVKLIKCNSFR